jgi:hypothetical protein
MTEISIILGIIIIAVASCINTVGWEVFKNYIQSFFDEVL